MEKKNIVFIARSLDGFIADRNGGIDWLYTIPNPDNIDMGYNALMGEIDAVVMGRNTFDIVCSFDIPWPYSKPVYLLSRTLIEVPEKYAEHVTLVKGNTEEILAQIHAKGHGKLYIDGGKTIQSFMKEDLIDEMILTTMPVLLGGGSSLFGELAKELHFEHQRSEVFLNAIVQDRYFRSRQ